MYLYGNEARSTSRRLAENPIAVGIPRIKKTIIWLVIIEGIMFSFSFAVAPLYRVFCELTGLNGRVRISSEEPRAITQSHIDSSRTITVQFVTTLNENMPWEFRPLQKATDVHPGELTRVLFLARNLSAQTMVAQAIPSISPGLVTRYFNKTECFCFNQQVLKAGEAIEMPVVFMLDPQVPKKYPIITLSYTLFDVTTSKPFISGRKGTL